MAARTPDDSPTGDLYEIRMLARDARGDGELNIKAMATVMRDDILNTPGVTDVEITFTTRRLG